MQVCEIEKSNWLHQLQRFLRAYRAAPHKSKGIALSAIMFSGRRCKTRLPTRKTHQNVFKKEMKEANCKSKQRLKKYADYKSYVKKSDIKVGDWVLVKQLNKNKLTPSYYPERYEVTQRNGSRVIAKRPQKLQSQLSCLFYHKHFKIITV